MGDNNVEKGDSELGVKIRDCSNIILHLEKGRGGRGGGVLASV